MDKPRFNQLLDLARSGDEASVAQLWHEFGFDFYAEETSATSHPTHDTRPPEGGASC